MSLTICGNATLPSAEYEALLNRISNIPYDFDISYDADSKIMDISLRLNAASRITNDDLFNANADILNFRAVSMLRELTYKCEKLKKEVCA